MKAPIMPTPEPLLIPQKKRRNKKSKGPAVVVMAKVPEPPKPPEPPEPAAKPEPKKFTLEEAFGYFYEMDHSADVQNTIDIERATRAVAFLLHWSSNMGNAEIDGRAAAGLGHILEKVASDMAKYPPPKVVYIGGPEPENPPEAS
jgi:hypothetical protein